MYTVSVEAEITEPITYSLYLTVKVNNPEDQEEIHEAASAVLKEHAEKLEITSTYREDYDGGSFKVKSSEVIDNDLGTCRVFQFPVSVLDLAGIGGQEGLDRELIALLTREKLPLPAEGSETTYSFVALQDCEARVQAVYTPAEQAQQARH